MIKKEKDADKNGGNKLWEDEGGGRGQKEIERKTRKASGNKPYIGGVILE